ncbi:transferase activity protein [[Candida] boidinii]|nr:transferase activity protein [[Candida] boidinii]
MSSEEEIRKQELLKKQHERQQKKIAKDKRKKVYSDILIQGTNDSSIVSKRSVERYYTTVLERKEDKQPPAEYFKHFVKKPQRRSPVINRGYWIRMEAIKTTVLKIVENSLPLKKINVINLGCGYDPLPFQMLDQYKNTSWNFTTIDVDYPDLINNKCKMIDNSPELQDIIDLKEKQVHDVNSPIQLRTESYAAVGCDLKNVDNFHKIMSELGLDNQDSVSIFIAEVSLAYMLPQYADPVIKETSLFANSHFIILEQLLPAGVNHPFARTMLNHFNHLKAPIQCVETYPTIPHQFERFTSLGYTSVEATDLLGIWDYVVDAEVKKKISQIEAFDEWEEFMLFCQHYIILHATISNVTDLLPTNKLEPKKENQKDSKISHVAKGKISIQQDAGKKDILKRKFIAGSNIDGDNFVITGGAFQSRLTDSVLLSSKETPFMIGKTKMSGRLSNSCVTLKDNTLYSFGGRSIPGRPLQDIWKLKHGEDKEFVWSKLTAELPEGRSKMSAVSVSETEALIFGGSFTGELFLKFSADDDSITPMKLAGDILTHKESPSMCWNSKSKSGVIFGGINQDESIDRYLYTFTIDKDTVEVKKLLENKLFARYGSKCLFINDEEILIIGGTSKDIVFNQDNTIIRVNVSTGKIQQVSINDENWSQSPIFVGFEIFTHENTVTCVGGGAVCFSFGSAWNPIFNIHLDDKEQVALFANSEVEDNQHNSNHSRKDTDRKKQQNNDSPVKITQIPLINFDQLTKSKWNEIIAENKPVVIKKAPLGESLEKWTSPEYLADKVGKETEVVIHSATSSNMNFQTKNFSYKTVKFEEFINSVFRDPNSVSYLRALSFDSPKEKATMFHKDFPNLANDFVLPNVLSYIKEAQHSSPLRITSPNSAVWLHYDVTSNILCQVVGIKKLRLYPPSDVDLLDFPSGKSSSLIEDVFKDEDVNQNSSLSPYECELSPGDVLFLPRMWLHATCTQSPSISLNFFWKDLKDDVYSAGKDIYGNRDIRAYENSRKMIERIKHMFEDDNIPEDVTDFYLRRLAEEVKYL